MQDLFGAVGNFRSAEDNLHIWIFKFQLFCQFQNGMDIPNIGTKAYHIGIFCGQAGENRVARLVDRTL